MKAVILAGGFGTRISEESFLKPKPMIEIGGKPILWHILKIYSAHGVNEFIICCGYKGYVIKEYFANYFLHMSDVTFNIGSNEMEVHVQHAEPWKVTLVDTGENTMTGGRIKRVKKYIEREEEFFLTYGDGLSDVDISASLEYHRAHGKIGTVTTAISPARFGAVRSKSGQVIDFQEKPNGSDGMVNAGFFIFSPKFLSFIADDDAILEREPLEQLASSGELMSWEHEGYWQPMDTLREKEILDKQWETGQAPWKKWD